MPLPRHLLEQQQARRDEEATAANRDKFRDYAWTAAQCVIWCVLGLLCIGWGLHTNDATYGKAALYAGVGIGNGGIIFSLLAAYRRGEERGDW